jgi:putative phage-type endonuclease
MTAPAMTTRADWLEWRRDGIGGSDAAAVCGLSPFGNPWTVWADKTGLTPLEGRPDDRGRRAGRLLEPAILEWFEEDSGIEVHERQALVVHPDRPWMRATLDGRAYPPAVEAQDPTPDYPACLGVVEAKWSNGRDARWTDGVPEYVVIQAQHQMAVDQADRAYVAVLVGDAFLWYELERDDRAIGELMTIEERFWTKHVLGGMAPDVDGSNQTAQALRAAFARPMVEERELPDVADELIGDYLRATALMVGAKAARQKAANRLQVLMGSAEVGTVRGRPVVRWSLVQRRSFTVKATEYRKLTVVGGIEE